MPEINRFACDRCDFQLPTGWGGYCYAVDKDGQRVVCPHPAEVETISDVTGMKHAEALAAGRTGFNAHCVCLTCLRQFDLDMK